MPEANINDKTTSNLFLSKQDCEQKLLNKHIIPSCTDSIIKILYWRKKFDENINLTNCKLIVFEVKMIRKIKIKIK